MKIWAVANQKGGVGKTTTAVTLGGLLAGEGVKTLLVDLDPHGSLTTYFGNDPDTIVSSVYNLFRIDQKITARDILLPTRFENLSILPSSTALATLDRQLGKQDGMGLVVAQALAELAGEYDYVLMDCPPILGMLMVNALAACNHLIVPVQTEFLALKGLERMLRTLKMVQRARGAELSYTVVPTLFDRRTRASRDTCAALRDQYSENLWSGVIPVDTQLREASQAGVPLSMYKPSSRAVVAYQELLNNLDGRDPEIEQVQAQ
ncbi:MAG: ParA family protein [Gammaproteobacteria bacterium]|nr:ParA family protein [Gammaproteobacteria bacterium]